jgi:hypothetical protein
VEEEDRMGATGDDTEDRAEDTEELDDQADDLEDDTGDDDGDGDQEEYTPPTQEEWEKVQGALARRKQERNQARAERAKLRNELAEARKATTTRNGDSVRDGDGDQQSTSRDEDRDDRAAEEIRWRQAAARSSAATQLQAAGFSGTAKQAKKLTRLIDLDLAEPDDDGDFDFEEAIDELREEYPQLFRGEDKPTPPRQRRPTTADRGRDTGRDATRNPSDVTSQALLRQAGIRRR